MGFVVTDLLSTASSAASDGIVRSTRSTAVSGSAIRKDFSSVLQGVRGDEKKGITQGAEGPQGSYKVEGRPDTKQSKGLNSAASQPERSDATQVRTSDSETVQDDDIQTIDSSREESESPMLQSNAGSGVEGQVVAAMTPASVSQAGAQTMVSEMHDAHDGGQASDGDGSSVGAPSSEPVMTDAPVRPTENHPLEKKTVSVPPDVPEPAQDASPLQKGAEPHATQSIELKGSEAKHDAKGMTTGSAQAQPTIHASLSGGAVLSPDQHASQIVQAHEGKLSMESPFDRGLGTLDRGENSAAPHAQNNPAHLLVPTHDDQGDSGTRVQGLTLPGQPTVVDQEAAFSQSGHDSDGQRHGNPEPKAFQGTAVDLQAMNGRTTEHYAAVAQSQTVPAPPAPSPTVMVPPVHPTFPAPDMTQQPIPSILRSVVLDVAQPDLGHVNIRVAMMNDSVHAHFSTDRAEIGQFLINGQDRLQTTLQANGLDMGQFRVDIDRQNGGRSFYQGSFQEQGHSGHQGTQGVTTEQAQGRSEERSRRLDGRLNVVA